MCSSKALKKLKNFKNKNYKILEIKSLNLKKLIKININNINQLGSDRIVNSIEGKKFNNCLIIDFGTATTFDIVKKWNIRRWCNSSWYKIIY